ncbi:MAG: hypothetical protein IJI98_05415 [Methanosphaera sp.]|nr:hypothetical protein [Methanosphaera sp.]
MGQESVSVEYLGNDTINSAKANTTFKVIKKDAKISINPIHNTKVGNTSITGKLVDEQNNPISGKTVTVKVNDQTITTTTDKNGNYQVVTTNAKEGLNNVTVTFTDDQYNTGKATTGFTASKLKTKVTVESVNGIIGEDITLTAHVTDENGKPVTGGNLVFKLNGRSLRTDGRFDTDKAEPIKFKVENGLVTFTMKADLYLRAGKNITASYSGSYMYESAKGNVAQANIKKRTAQISVKVTPRKAKQDTDIVFTATLKDVTQKASNKECLTTGASVLFKVNGVTLKDKNGNKIQVPAKSNVVNYEYHVARGTAGYDHNGNIRNYTVEAVYVNNLFYPDTRNKTVFNVDRSIVNVNFIKTVVKNDNLSLKATLTDYENKNLVGTSKICIKINGHTYKENGKVRYFNVKKW